MLLPWSTKVEPSKP